MKILKTTEEQIKALNKKIKQLKKNTFYIPIVDLKICKKKKHNIIQSIYKNKSIDSSFWKSFIKQKFDSDQVCVVEMPMDGNCLFHSLSSYIKHKNARKLRHSIVDHERSHKKKQILNFILSDPSETPEYVKYLEEHDLDFEKLTLKEKFDIYLKIMKTSGVYGQYLEINSFCEIFNLNVIILTDGNNVHVNTPANKPSEKNIFLFYQEKVLHFDVLYIKPDKIP